MAVPQLGKPFEPTDYEEDSDLDTSTTSIRRFLDPVHDYVCLEPRVAALVDTKQFQRLRYLKQLGTAYFVFPGAAHNRFEHCLGVAHLAGLMIDGLRTRQPKLGITDRDVLCVQIAGLVHDLGHGPFSHVFDEQFISRVCPERKWRHEEASEMMFDALIKQNPHISLPQDHVDFIKDLIRGRARLTKQEKPFLFQIVANAENGLDVDKFDYIARDALNCGVKHGVTTSRFINECRVIDDQICYPSKDMFNVFQVYHTRYALHKQVYNHKTVKAAEQMVVDALVAADAVLKLSQMIDNPDAFLCLTDSILETIENSNDPALAKSRQIMDRLRRRNLYRIVDFKAVPIPYRDAWKSLLTAENIVAEAKTLAPDDSEYIEINCDDVIVDFSELHMGMKDKNPMEHVRFYSKQKRNVSFASRPDEGFNIRPETFGEVHICILTRDPAKGHVVRNAYGKLLEKLPDLVTQVPTAADAEPTPTLQPAELPPGPGGSFESAGTAVGSNPITPVNRPIPLSTSPHMSELLVLGSPGTVARQQQSMKRQNRFYPPSTTKKPKRQRDEKDHHEEVIGVLLNDGSPKYEQPPRTRQRVD